MGETHETHGSTVVSQSLTIEPVIEIFVQYIYRKAINRLRQVVCMEIAKDNWYKSEQGINRVLGELARCGNQFVGDIKKYLL